MRNEVVVQKPVGEDMSLWNLREKSNMKEETEKPIVLMQYHFWMDFLPRGLTATIRMAKSIDRMPLFPGSWSAVIATALIGTLAYLFVYWIRLKEINRTRGPKEQLTLKELIEEDWGIVLKSVQKNEPVQEEAPKTQKSKASLRRGSSSGNLKGQEKAHSTLKRMPSGSGATLRIRMVL